MSEAIGVGAVSKRPESFMLAASSNSHVEAVAKWRFRPARKGGRPVAVQAQVEVNFRLL